MSTFNGNIRIYASIGGQAKFYDVIGRYAIPGGVANPSGSGYAIDLGLYLPVIRTTVTYNNETQYKYYYIPMDSSNSNRLHTASEVPSANIDLVESFIVGNTTYQTYSLVNGTPDDLYALANSYALNTAATIYSFNDSATANATWSTYNLEVVYNGENVRYLIRQNGNTIYDNANLLSSQEEGNVSLVETTNTDITSIDPSNSTVESLTSFTITYEYNISSIASSGHSIKIFNALTQDVVREIGLPTRVSGSDNKVTFSTNLNQPGTYYLYVPIGTVNFTNGDSSERLVKRYTIQAQNAGGDVQSYTVSPLSGTTYEDLNIEFSNVSSILGYDSTNPIQIDLMNGNSVITESHQELTYGLNNNGYVYSKSGNVFKISNLHTAITSCSKGYMYLRIAGNIRVKITIPQDTISIANGISSNLIQIYYTLIGTENLTSDTITYSCYPANGSNVYKLYRLEFTFPLTSSSQEVVVDLDKIINVIQNEQIISGLYFKYASSETKYIYQGGYRQVLLYFYLYNNSLEFTIDETGTYYITFPLGVFIKSDGSNISSTLEFTLSYAVVGYSSDEQTDSFANYYCHGLLRVKGNNTSKLSFRQTSDVDGESNTIFINNNLLGEITIFPRLEITETVVDENGNDTGTLKSNSPRVYSLEDNDILVMSLSISGGDKRKNYTYNYNPDRDLSLEDSLLFRYNHESSLRDLLDVNLISQVPKKLRIDFVMNFNSSRFKFNTYILILPEPIYLNYKKSISDGTVYSIKNNIDLYTGKESEEVYVSSKSTEYDEIVSEKFDDEGTDILLYPAKLDTVTKVRLGNLDGIYDEKQKGKQPYGFGLYGQNVFLTGNFYLNNGRSLVDISDDILMANGNITGIRERIDNLNDEFKDLSTELSTDLKFVREAMPATISNFISTNKTALFRLGLDTSIWALGSAGISLYNPNVSYVPDNKTGKMVVDESTVGDFDESILMLADNIKINNYVKYIDGNNNVYYKVLICDVNPKSWIYDEDSEGKTIVSSRPLYEYNGGAYPIGEGNLKYGWVDLSWITNANSGSNIIRLENTFNCETILRYIKIDDSGDEIRSVGRNDSGQIYSFSSYYRKLNGQYYANPGDINYTSLFNSETYFVPVVIQAALFDNGIINAKYIKVEHVTAENILAISTDYLEGNNGAEYNEAFDITKDINEGNYPVIKSSTGENDYDAPFVVISGTTGAITATSADISGNITIGNKYSDNSYLKLYKGVGNTAPGMYIYNRDSSNNTFKEVASFGGIIKSNPLSIFTSSEGTGSFATGWMPTSGVITKSVTALFDGNLPNPRRAPAYNTLDECVIGYASATDTIQYSYDVPIILENDIPILITGKLSFGTAPVFTKTYIPTNCYTSAYATSLIYLDFDTKSEYLGSYSYLFYRAKNTSSLYTDRTIDPDLSDRTFSLEIPASYITNVNGGRGYLLSFRIYTTIFIEYDPTTINPEQRATVTYSTGTLKFTGTYTSQRYHASFFGNGLTIGYNSLNYFGTYFLDNKMVFDFLSNGAGMLFDNGSVYNYINNKKIRGFIPILLGTVKVQWKDYGDGYYYYFSGVSIVNNGGINSTNDLYAGLLIPYRDTGLCYKNTTSPGDYLVKMDDWDLIITYSSTHDIYLYRYREGVITLCFGQSWVNALLLNLISEDNIIVSAIGKCTVTHNWSSGGSPANIGGIYPGYVSVCKVDGDTHNFLNLKSLVYSSGEWTTSSTTLTRTSYGNICFFFSDDYSTNDGEFYLTIYYCPNT